VLAIGSAISLVSQTYHITGNFTDFVLCWSLLVLPLAYLLRSTSVAMLYMAGITVWAGCRADHREEMLCYWPLFAAVIPFYAGLVKENRTSNRANLLSAIIAISVGIAIAFQSSDILDETWFLLFSGYFAVLYLVERRWLRRETPSRFPHPFRVIGAAGIMVLSIVMSFGEFWRTFYRYHIPQVDTPTYYAAFALSYGFGVAAILLLVFCWRKKTDFNVCAGLFPVVAWVAYLFFMREDNTSILILMNCYAAVLALGTIVRGFRHNRLGTLNAGMLIAAALIVARFFDSDISFVVRGVAFIVTGAGFLAANWYLIKRRKGAVA